MPLYSFQMKYAFVFIFVFIFLFQLQQYIVFLFQFQYVSYFNLKISRLYTLSKQKPSSSSTQPSSTYLVENYYYEH